jgi:hypothetical protein
MSAIWARRGLMSCMRISLSGKAEYYRPFPARTVIPCHRARPTRAPLVVYTVARTVRAQHATASNRRSNGHLRFHRRASGTATCDRPACQPRQSDRQQTLPVRPPSPCCAQSTPPAGRSPAGTEAGIDPDPVRHRVQHGTTTAIHPPRLSTARDPAWQQSPADSA